MRAAVALMLVAGCSFFTMHSPEGTPPVCNSSRATPIVDTIATVAAPFIAYALIASNNRNSGDGNNAIEGVVAFFVTTPVMAVTGSSAIYGFIKADRCERAMRDYQQLMAAPPMYPPPMYPPPTAPPPTAPPPPGS